VPLKYRQIRKLREKKAGKPASPHAAIRWATGSPDTACTGKIRYPDLSSAGQGVRGSNLPLEAYRCLYCGGYHLGHKKSARMTG
jgi:hypothetical protein